MNLLYIRPTFPPHTGGAEWLLDDLTRLLAAWGHDVTVITGTPATPDIDAGRRGVRVLRVVYPVLGAGVLGWLPTLVRQAALWWRHLRVIRGDRVEAVGIGVFNLTALYVFLVAPFARFRLVIYLHGGETRHHRRKSRLFRWVYSYGLRRCNAVVAVSEDLKELARSFALEDRVIFTGAVARPMVYGLLKRAELVVLPSWAEGNPLILMEAIVAGSWVLASDVKGNRDLIEPGRNGCLFPPDDDEQLARMIVDLTSNRGPNGTRDREGDRADLGRFDLGKLVERHVRVLMGTR